MPEKVENAYLRSAESWDALWALSECCYRDSEREGDGWATAREVADELGLQQETVQLRLKNFVHGGLAEVSRGNPLRFAPTERAVALLEARDRS